MQLARGNDRYKFHNNINRPKKFMQNENLIARDISNKELQKILYKDSKKIGKY